MVEPLDIAFHSGPSMSEVTSCNFPSPNTGDLIFRSYDLLGLCCSFTLVNNAYDK